VSISDSLKEAAVVSSESDGDDDDDDQVEEQSRVDVPNEDVIKLAEIDLQRIFEQSASLAASGRNRRGSKPVIESSSGIHRIICVICVTS
jgi:hypothetical protein